MTDSKTLNTGEWIWRQIDQQWRTKTPVFTGAWEVRRVVGYVTRYQAMALARWHGSKGLYYTVADANDRRIDIRVAGDIEAFHGDAR